MRGSVLPGAPESPTPLSPEQGGASGHAPAFLTGPAAMPLGSSRLLQSNSSRIAAAPPSQRSPPRAGAPSGSPGAPPPVLMNPSGATPQRLMRGPSSGRQAPGMFIAPPQDAAMQTPALVGTMSGAVIDSASGRDVTSALQEQRALDAQQYEAARQQEWQARQPQLHHPAATPQQLQMQMTGLGLTVTNGVPDSPQHRQMMRQAPPATLSGQPSGATLAASAMNSAPPAYSASSIDNLRILFPAAVADSVGREKLGFGAWVSMVVTLAVGAPLMVVLFSLLPLQDHHDKASANWLFFSVYTGFMLYIVFQCMNTWVAFVFGLRAKILDRKVVVPVLASMVAIVCFAWVRWPLGHLNLAAVIGVGMPLQYTLTMREMPPERVDREHLSRTRHGLAAITVGPWIGGVGFAALLAVWADFDEQQQTALLIVFPVTRVVLAHWIIRFVRECNEKAASFPAIIVHTLYTTTLMAMAPFARKETALIPGFVLDLLLTWVDLTRVLNTAHFAALDQDIVHRVATNKMLWRALAHHALTIIAELFAPLAFAATFQLYTDGYNSGAYYYWDIVAEDVQKERRGASYVSTMFFCYCVSAVCRTLFVKHVMKIQLTRILYAIFVSQKVLVFITLCAYSLLVTNYLAVRHNGANFGLT